MAGNPQNFAARAYLRALCQRSDTRRRPSESALLARISRPNHCPRTSNHQKKPVGARAGSSVAGDCAVCHSKDILLSRRLYVCLICSFLVFTSLRALRAYLEITLRSAPQTSIPLAKTTISHCDQIDMHSLSSLIHPQNFFALLLKTHKPDPSSLLHN